MAASPSHGASTRLPGGECSYRDLGLGTAAPTCGCNRFWVDESRRKLVPGGTSKDESDARQTPWCICGHHACFHKDSRKSMVDPPGIDKANKTSPGQAPSTSPDSDAVYVQYVRHTQDGRMQLVTGSPTTTPKKPTMAAPAVQKPSAPSTVQETPFQPMASQQYGRVSQSAQQSRNTITTQMLSNVSRTRPFPSPRLPAIQRLEGSRPSSAGSQYPRASSQNRGRELSRDAQKQTNAGLGLNFALPGIAPSLPSTTNSVQTGELPDWARLLKEFNERSASNASSTTGEMHRTSPSTAFLQRASQQLSQQRGPLLPPVTTGYSFADDRVTEELSATEIATPSNRGTPDLRAFENTLNEVRETVDRQPNAINTVHAEPSSSQRSPPNAAVSGLQRLLPHLNAIRDYMATMPHESIRQRLDALENMSFNQVPVDELCEKNEYFEAYLIDIQNKLEEHSDLLNIMQGEGSSKRRRLLFTGDEAVNASFTSNSSVQSATSSAIIAAAIERQETEAKIKDVEERLSQLESTALPSFAHPLEVEVVFLPWGKELKGIWSSPDNAPAQNSVFTTQGSDEWTQAMNSSQMGPSLHQSGHSGWSSDDIHDWADSTDEWLCARACSPTSTVYQRLRSRGFVKIIELKRSDAREFQSSLKTAFLGLSQYFPIIGTEETSQSLGDPPSSTSFLGLRRPFVPLRKIHKSSRLRFLSTFEMLTPAIWTAEFLSSVIMRAQGGQKRLFVTNPDAYLQHNDHNDAGWTWQKLRELPRIASPDGHSESGVGEADAKEACWNFHPKCDPPQSITSSFSSIVSSHVSRASVRGTPPPTSQHASQPSLQQGGGDHAPDNLIPSKVSSSFQARRRYPPITPLSNISRHRRTASAPISEHSTAVATTTPTAGKRRIISFDSVPHPRDALKLSRGTSALSIQSGSSAKRQRVSRSPEIERSAVAAAQGFTPRRSKEPPSPFYPASSQGVPLPRSQGHTVGDQAAAGPSAARASWEAPAAYATPYSGGQMLQSEAMTATDMDTQLGSVMAEDQEEVWEGVTEAEEPGNEAISTEVPSHVETIEISSANQNEDYLYSDNDSDGEDFDNDEDDEDKNTGDLDAVFDGRQF